MNFLQNDICHYQYFLNKEFKFQTNVCNRCDDLLMFMNLSDVAILNKSVFKSEAINLMQNINLTKKCSTL